MKKRNKLKSEIAIWLEHICFPLCRFWSPVQQIATVSKQKLFFSFFYLVTVISFWNPVLKRESWILSGYPLLRVFRTHSDLYFYGALDRFGGKGLGVGIEKERGGAAGKSSNDRAPSSTAVQFIVCFPMNIDKKINLQKRNINQTSIDDTAENNVKNSSTDNSWIW